MHLSIVLWLYMALQCRSSIPDLPYFWGISSSPAAFLFLIFLSTESSSSCVNCPSLISSWLLIIFMIGSCITFRGFSKTFDSIHRGKMEQILLTYSLHKETVAAIMMLYKNMKVKVCSPDGHTDYFDIVADVLQGDTLTPYLFIICQDYWFNERKWFQADKGKKQKILAQTITDMDYTDDIALLANTPIQAETLQHSLEWAAAGIGLHVKTDKTEYMCFNQRGDISTLKGGPLKLVDKFSYLGSRVSSTEKDINMRLAKAWSAIDRLSVIWKSDLTNKIKHSFFQAAVVSILLYGC